MARAIEEILNPFEEQSLREDFDNVLECGGGYDDVEELMLNYGLEMDYVFDLLGY